MSFSWLKLWNLQLKFALGTLLISPPWWDFHDGFDHFIVDFCATFECDRHKNAGGMAGSGKDMYQNSSESRKDHRNYTFQDCSTKCPSEQKHMEYALVYSTSTFWEP